MRRAPAFVLLAVVVAALAIGLVQAGGGGSDEKAPPFSLEDSLARLKGAPAPLAGLHGQANGLLDGEAGAFKRQMASLKGHPVVVNKWASWCGPCRAEFPVFQKVSTDLGKEVAFLGLNSGDNRDDATAFLKKFPIPFPSVVDPAERAAREAGLPANYPMTAFYDESGKRTFVHQGQYRTEADLLADIEKYAR
jgi:thiol-disulfide isomerase/thioredoxin